MLFHVKFYALKVLFSILELERDYATLRHKLLNKKWSILHAGLIQIVTIFRKLPRWAWQALKVWKKW